MLVLKPANDVPPAPPTPTNELLMARIREHDGEALWMLHQRHADFLRTVIARVVPDEDACEKVLRVVFEEIRDRAGYYGPEMGKALAWMMTLARRKATEYARGIKTPSLCILAPVEVDSSAESPIRHESLELEAAPETVEFAKVAA